MLKDFFAAETTIWYMILKNQNSRSMDKPSIKKRHPGRSNIPRGWSGRVKVVSLRGWLDIYIWHINTYHLIWNYLMYVTSAHTNRCDYTLVATEYTNTGHRNQDMHHTHHALSPQNCKVSSKTAVYGLPTRCSASVQGTHYELNEWTVQIARSSFFKSFSHYIFIYFLCCSFSVCQWFPLSAPTQHLQHWLSFAPLDIL